jgi:hypothetical protein
VLPQVYQTLVLRSMFGQSHKGFVVVANGYGFADEDRMFFLDGNNFIATLMHHPLLL